MQNNRGYAAIGLDNPKNPLNVGSVLRAANCYGAAMVAITGERPKRLKKRMVTDTQKAYKRIPLLAGDNLRDFIPHDCIPVAVDLIEGATSLNEFTHPERAFYIFGAEDATLGTRITSWCKHSIYVPTDYCMNLAATVNVVLYDRQLKRSRIL